MPQSGTTLAPDVAQLEAQLGVTFTDRALLRLALTHRSTVSEHTGRNQRVASPTGQPATNERLEFLGDAILAYVTAEYLFTTFPQLSEGELTDVRAALVKAPTLARFARSIALERHIILGKGEEMTGGRARDALQAAAFEAVIGALARDQGFATASAFILRLVTPEAEKIVATRRFKDDKSILQELAQARLGHTPSYRVVGETGPAHQRTYTVEVIVGELVAGRGSGPSKQRAEQDAAGDALAQDGWQPPAEPPIAT